MTEQSPSSLPENISTQFGDHLCAAPFSSVHIGPEGLVSPCCKTRYPLGNFNTDSLENIVNSENSRKLRSAFLKGERPDACRSCWRQENLSDTISDVRLFNNKNAVNDLNDIIYNTTDQFKPVWLDLLWTNKCNFACLGCSPELSSTIANNYQHAHYTLHPDSRKSSSIIWQNDSKKMLKYILDHSDSLRLIHLNGGEPFMSEDFHELLEEMIKRGLHKTIKIWSHTNGSITTSYRGVDIIENYLVHWGDRCSITLSNDGHGDRGAYIRYGYRDHKWLETFDKIKRNGIKVAIQSCLNVFNALTIDEWTQWLHDNCRIGSKVPAKIVPWSSRSVAVTLFSADQEYRDIAISKLTNVITDGAPKFWTDPLIGAVRSIKNADESFYTPAICQAFDRGVAEYDRLRGTDFATTFPELVEFRNRLIKKTVL